MTLHYLTLPYITLHDVSRMPKLMSTPMIDSLTGVGEATNQVGALLRHLAVGLFRVVEPPYALGRAYD